MKERRKHAREQVPDVAVSWKAWSVWDKFKRNPIVSWAERLRVMDLSAGGLAFATETSPPEVGSKLLCGIYVDDDQQAAELQGEVVWATRRRDWSESPFQSWKHKTFGVGVQFLSPDDHLLEKATIAAESGASAGE